MDQEEPLFLPASFFMVRTPFLPIDDFFALLQGSDIHASLLELFDREEYIREALAIASPSLYLSLMARKDSKQSRSSLLKYFSRMTTRSTPFGIFSFISVGAFAEAASAFFDLTKIHKKVRPDMEWQTNVVEQICTDPGHFPALSVFRNPLIFEAGGRAFLNYLRKNNVEDELKTISIRMSFLVQAIFEHAKKPIPIQDLQGQMIQSFPALDGEKVLGVIRQLVKQQFLCFTLFPSLLTESPFKDLLAKLSFVPSAFSELKEIAAKIENYQCTQAGQGEKQLLELQKTMQNVAKAGNYLQVDAAYEAAEVTLPKEIGKELGEAAEVLWQISSQKSASGPLESYHKKFIEKYGIHRTIPLLELLDENGGLGVPESYARATPETISGSRPNTLWDKWLKQQWAHCVREKRKEIVLDEKVLERTLKKGDKTKAILSFDLFCEVIARSSAKVDEKDYLLQISSHNLQGAASFGRFMDSLGIAAKEKIAAFYREEEALEAGNAFAESSYFSFNPRHANVSIHSNMRKRTIDLASADGIPVEEIFVGATLDRLYLTLKDHGQELIATAGNMLSPMMAPSPIRFIRDVSMARHQRFYLFPWNDLHEHSYLPRVRFKQVILSPARWKVDLFSLDAAEKEALESLEKKFHAWREDWNVPRYVFIGDADQRILIDLDHPEDRQEMLRQISKGEETTFVEKIGQSEGQWVQSQKGRHLSEFVVPFLKNPKYSLHRPLLNFPKSQPIPRHSRLKLPGSEWLFAKCYLDGSEDNRFLIDQCARFAESLYQQKIITDWFFIRYADPKFHIRLRLKGEPEQIIGQAIPALHQWGHQLLEERHIREIIFSPYEREVERYGGEALIESAETFFHADSLSVIELLRAIRGLKIALAEEVVAALSLVDLLKGFYLDVKQQLHFFSSHEIAKNELAGFRSCKGALVSYCNAIFNETLEEFSEDGALLHSVFQKRKALIQEFARKMQEVGEKKELTTSPLLIQSSLLHMHCNRLLGIDSRKESKAKLYAFQALKVISNKASLL